MIKENKEFSIPMAIIVAGAMIAGAVYFGGSAPSAGPRVANGAAAGNYAAPTGEVEPVSNDDHVFGDRDAEVTVIEYSDLECPFCKSFHNTMHQIVTAYEGKVNWVYRHFPIAQLHQKAVKEAEASECAFDQGGNSAFWGFIDKVFARTQSNDRLDSSELPKIAGELGLDVAKFNNCLTNGDNTEKIQEAVTKAVQAGAQGTPYSVIVTKDGKQVVINGAEPFEAIKAKIDSVLK